MVPGSVVEGSFTDDAGYTCGLRTDGMAECWGSWNEEAEQLLFHPLSSQFSQISAGNRHVYGVSLAQVKRAIQRGPSNT